MLNVDNITYRKNNKSLIEGISLDFSPGLLYGIVGPNGSGKSTLLKIMRGIWKPTLGKIKWQGKSILGLKQEEMNRLFSLVPQNPQPSFDYSVFEMVAMGGYPQRQTAKIVIEEALQKVDGWHLRDHPITKISQGEKQRVYIARALVRDSPILLLDEPTNSLDHFHQKEIWHLLKNLAGQNRIVIVVSHDLISVKHFCDYIIVLQGGNKVASGPKPQIGSFLEENEQDRQDRLRRQDTMN